jgi:hypothetical protein
MAMNEHRVNFKSTIIGMILAYLINESFLYLWFNSTEKPITFYYLQNLLILFIVGSLISIFIALYTNLVKYSHIYRGFYLGFSIGSIMRAGNLLVLKILKPQIGFHDVYLISSLFFSSLFALYERILTIKISD